MQSLFDFDKPAHARNTDPVTSHEAAASLGSSVLSQLRADVLAMITDAGEPGLTQEEGWRLYIAKYNGGQFIPRTTVTTRFSEVERMGLIVRTDRRRKTPSGRWAAVYTSTPAPRTS